MPKTTYINIYNGSDFEVNQDDLFNAPLPEYDPNGRFKPLAHSVMHEQTTALIESLGQTIEESQFYMTDNGMRAIGTYRFASQYSDDFSNQITFYNANDKSSSTKMAAGKLQHACLNSMVSGEVVYKTAHTKHIEDRLPNLLSDAIHAIGDYVIHQEVQQLAYKEIRLDEQSTPHQQFVDHLIMEATRAKVINTSNIRRVENHYWNPEHDEFAEDGHSIHRMFQAFTSTWRDGKMPYMRVARESNKLEAVLNKVVGPKIQEVAEQVKQDRGIDDMLITADDTETTAEKHANFSAVFHFQPKNKIEKTL